jgi:hypothetical protein
MVSMLIVLAFGIMMVGTGWSSRRYWETQGQSQGLLPAWTSVDSALVALQCALGLGALLTEGACLSETARVPCGMRIASTLFVWAGVFWHAGVRPERSRLLYWIHGGTGQEWVLIRAIFSAVAGFCLLLIALLS